MASRKEVRGNSLLSAIKSVLPHVGYLKIDPNSSGRKATFTFRGDEFVCSSRLHVQKAGFGLGVPFGLCEDSDAQEVEGRLKA